MWYTIAVVVGVVVAFGGAIVLFVAHDLNEDDWDL